MAGHNPLRLYEVLGVDKSAKPIELKKAYRARAKVCHEDKGGTGDAMAELNEAKENLFDAEKRKLYDSTGKTGAFILACSSPYTGTSSSYSYSSHPFLQSESAR